MTAADADFASWRAGFYQRALAQGIAPTTLSAALVDLQPLPEVLDKDRAQAEFTLTVRDYLDRVLTPARIMAGQAALARHADLFARLEAHFGVERAILAAIWGIETSYGQNRGTQPLLSALATLAHDGRRAAFFEGECLAALRLADRCGIDPSRLSGSWAGASGHMQFMPSSVLAHALDFDGDGRIDLWSDDPADALASAAAYLRHFGWHAGEAPITRAHPSPVFDPYCSGRAHRLTLTGWQARGVGADPGTAGEDLALILPAGHDGPGFFWGPNADVLARYNGSESYVLAVALLAARLAGRPVPDLVWPLHDRALSASEKREVQERLAALGHDPGGADGRIGPNTVRALKDWQRAVGLPADGHPTAALLDRLRQKG